VAVLTARDIPGVNDISPTGLNDEPILPETHVQFLGQPIFAVVAETREHARRACQKAKIEYEELPALLDPRQADPEKPRLVTKPLELTRGDANQAIASAPRRIRGQMSLGGQDHFYLEGHVAFAFPGEDM